MASLLTKKYKLEVIKEIDDKIFIKSVDNIISNKMNECELTNELKIQLDNGKSNHVKGISKLYSWKSIKNEMLFLSILLVLISCKKDKSENVSLSTSDMLKSNTWYAEKIQKISYNLNTNQFIKDTTYFVDSCWRNERIKMLNDSIAVGFILCGAPYDKNGIWYLHSDSITVAILYPFYGGSNYFYKGIKPSKLLEVDNLHFVTKETKIDGNYIYTPSPTNEREDYYTTYKKL
ncbi:MAG: hypothetical protein LH615_12455 [Ferruginibacter sp.]|nr:hypothetical protein [Ferruginibacter sp.]